MKKILAATIVALATTPVLAWGDREQGALAGLIVGALITKQVQNEPQPDINRPVIIHQRPPVIVGDYSMYHHRHHHHRYHPVCYTVMVPVVGLDGFVSYFPKNVCR